MSKRPRSEAQRAASRANGRRSRGPCTAEGKARSRVNAVKHGLRATSLQHLPAGLAVDDLRSLTAAARQQLAPRDTIEAEIADGIAASFWRLRRVRQVEEALLEGRRLTAGQDRLTQSFLRRTTGPDAMPLLLRYRSQALGELTRLFRLLDEHRRQDTTTDRNDDAVAGGSCDAASVANDNRLAAAGRNDGAAGDRPPREPA
jgi:hypothetical protein